MKHITKILKVVDCIGLTREHIASESGLSMEDVLSVEHGKADDELQGVYVDAVQEMCEVTVPDDVIEDRREYLTATVVAERLGVSSAAISYIEHRKKSAVKLEQGYLKLVRNMTRFCGTAVSEELTGELRDTVELAYLEDVEAEDIVIYAKPFLTTSRIHLVQQGLGTDKDNDAYIAAAVVAIAERIRWREASALMSERRHDLEFQEYIKNG